MILSLLFPSACASSVAPPPSAAVVREVDKDSKAYHLFEDAFVRMAEQKYPDIFKQIPQAIERLKKDQVYMPSDYDTAYKVLVQMVNGLPILSNMTVSAFNDLFRRRQELEKLGRLDEARDAKENMEIAWEEHAGWIKNPGVREGLRKMFFPESSDDSSTV